MLDSYIKANMNMLDLRNITIKSPHRTLCDHIDFSLLKGEKVALIARNGAGKSSLLDVIVGETHPWDGEVRRTPKVTVWYLSQKDDFDLDATVLDVLFTHENEIGQTIKAYEHALAIWDHDQLAILVEKIWELQWRDYETKISIVINQLHLADLLEQSISKCSGGELKRLALAKVLIDEPDVLILDEPTNHLDTEMIERLEQYLKKSSMTLLVVTHDRYFLERVCDRIIELDSGKLHSYPWNYSKYLEVKEQREEIESQQHHQMKQVLKRELAWMKKAPRARASKSVKREKEFAVLEQQFSSNKQQRFQQAKTIAFESSERRLGGKILKLHNVYKAFGEKKIVDWFTYDFRAGERVWLVGKNGVGKSTFIDLLLGRQHVDDGKRTAGVTVSMALCSQKDDIKDSHKKVIEVVKEVGEYMTLGNGKRISAAKLLEKFLFGRGQLYQRVDTLSGGERKRLHLLTILMSNPNFLILDEPTNDLDIMTLAMLEEFLRSFAWCLVVVSHDRFFMDKVVDHVLVFEGEGMITEFPGSYTDRYSEKHKTESIKLKTKITKQKTEVDLMAEEKVEYKKRRSLTNKEREEYRLLEEEIEKLEKRKEVITVRMSNETLDYETTRKLSEEFAALIERLDVAEERWLELLDIG